METFPPPNTLNLQFGSGWQIATPTVYRYEDERWIDLFFETGRLRLSTFEKFAGYPDEARGDTNEGKAVCVGKGPGNTTVVTAQGEGFSSVILCCSQRLAGDLRDSFARNSAFQITNTVGFAFEISRQLPGFRQGLEGPCIYRGDHTINRQNDIDIEKYRTPDGNIDMQFLRDVTGALGGPEVVLLKRKAYEYQQEYRLLWELDSAPDDYVDVVAPKALQHCRRIDADDWT